MVTTAAQMVADAKTRVRGLTPAEFEAHIYGEESLIVDLREPQEIDENGLIGGAYHAPRGLLEFWADPESPLHRPEFSIDRPTVLYCAAGSRSALAAVALMELGYEDVSHLDGGFTAWKSAGMPVAGAPTS